MKIEPKSKFVIPRVDVQDGDLIEILDEGEYRKLPQDPNREILVFKVLLPSEKIKLLSMNATSQRELIQAWGNESKKWINRKVKVEIVKQRVFDKTKDVIFLHPTDYASREIPEEEIPIVDEELEKDENQADIPPEDF